MAIIQSTYAFDADNFHQWLEKKVVEDSGIRLDLLHSLAQDSLLQPLEEMKMAFVNLRFDRDWLRLPDESEDVSNSNFWYLILLSSRFTVLPSLSIEVRNGVQIFRCALPLLGWNKRDADLVLYGKPLRLLIESAKISSFADEFRGMDQHGGWLDCDDTNFLLNGFKDLGTNSPSNLENVAKKITDTHPFLFEGKDALNELKIVCCSGISMLEMAISKRQAIFIIND